MNWQHVMVLLCCLALPAICGLSATCHDMMPVVKDLVMVIAGGVLGNAMKTAQNNQSKE